MEIIHEVIIKLFIPLTSIIGGFFIDSFFKIFNYKIKWGFACDRNPLLSTIAFFILLMIPFGVYYQFSTSTFLILLGSFCGTSLLLKVFYLKEDKFQGLNDILDENFINKRK